LSLTNLSTKRQRIAELARAKRGVALSTLHQVIDLEWLKEAYRLTRKDGALGVDGVTAADYAENLEANLLDLLARIKSGRYQAPPARRAYIPKTDGSRRPLGLPTRTSYCTSHNLSLGTMRYARGSCNPFAQRTVCRVGDGDGVAHPRLSLLC